MNLPFIQTPLFTILAYTLLCVESSKNDHISGQTLYNIGTKYNMTLVRIIGKAIKAIETEVRQVEEETCRQHRCGEWTKWSDCDVGADNQRLVGVQSRSRSCGENTTLCERYGISSVAVDYKVCEIQFTCPKEYILTEHGFCIKYYAGPKTWDDSEAFCRNDGGHLMQVDSVAKAKDINDTLLGLSLVSNLVWIDGRRSKQAGPWSYGYKTTDPNFTYWGDDDPDNTPDALCMLYNRRDITNFLWRWFDYPCRVKTQFICQISAE